MCVCAWVGVRAYCCCYCQHYKLITNWAEFKSALIPQAAVEQRIDKGFKIDCSFRCWHNCFCCVKTPSRIPMHTHTRTHTCSTRTNTPTHEHALCLPILPFQNLFFCASQDWRNVLQVFRAPEASRTWRVAWTWFHAGGHIWQRDEHKAGPLSNTTSNTVLRGFLR